jgi:DNA mismatch endonuclease, patch repair protein
VSALTYPKPTSQAVSVRMRANRSTDTEPERLVRSALHRAGLRFRKGLPIHAGEVRVRPDIAFTKSRVAVFIDGCFWHCCPEHGNQPNRNTSYWTDKLNRNVQRDRRVTAALTHDGWTVLRYWEHEPVDVVAEQIRTVVTTQAYTT